MASTGHKKKQMKKDPSFVKKKPLTYLPVQRKLQLGVSGAPGTQDAEFDTGRLLSQTNHRLYRYGKRYTQKVDVDPSFLTPGSTIDVWALMDTWYIQKAFEEAKTVFHRAYTDERENLSKEAIARWQDFRITSGLTGTSALFPVVDGIPTSAINALIVDGEFDDSIVEDANGVTGCEKVRAKRNQYKIAKRLEFDLEWAKEADIPLKVGVLTTTLPGKESWIRQASLGEQYRYLTERRTMSGYTGWHSKHRLVQSLQ